MRSAFSPIQMVTRLSHEELKRTHQILGQILSFFFVLHGAFYMNFYIQSGRLQKRIKDWDVICGVLGLSSFMIIGSTSLSFVRKRSYSLFYIIHATLALLVLEPLLFHVKHIRTYIYEVLGVVIVANLVRMFEMHTYTGRISIIPRTNLIQVRIPLSTLKKSKPWKAGQHVYLSRPTGIAASNGLYASLARRYYTNPFTIASLPEKDREIVLVARTLNGSTKKMAALARSIGVEVGENETPQTLPLTIEGPYGASVYLPDLQTFDYVLLIAGGVGATFTVPIYRSLSKSGSLGQSCKVQHVWAVQSLADTQWAFPEKTVDNDKSTSATRTMDIYVTRQAGTTHTTILDGTEEVELAEGEGLLSGQDSYKTIYESAKILQERPNIFAIVDSTFSEYLDGRIAVLACGPASLMDVVRRAVGKRVYSGQDVYFHAEAFEM
jgi:ferredoxin-NADP reductase